MASLAQLQQLRNNPNVRKFLDLLSYTEGTQGNGYYTAFGGSRLSSLADHPRYSKTFKQTDGKTNKTSAAGRYQFLRGTWDGLARKYGFQDFGAVNQDLGAIALLAENGALPHILNGNWGQAVAKAGGTWASLPSSPHPQPTKSWKKVSSFLGGYIPPQGNGYQPTTPIDPTLQMDSFALVKYLRKQNKTLTDNQIFAQLANHPGKAGEEVRYFLSQGNYDPRDIAKVLGLKKTVFSNDVVTHYDQLKAQATAKPNPTPNSPTQITPTQSSPTAKWVDDYFASWDAAAPTTPTATPTQASSVTPSQTPSQPTTAQSQPPTLTGTAKWVEDYFSQMGGKESPPTISTQTTETSPTQTVATKAKATTQQADATVEKPAVDSDSTHPWIDSYFAQMTEASPANHLSSNVATGTKNPPPTPVPSLSAYVTEQPKPLVATPIDEQTYQNQVKRFGLTA